MKNDRVILHSDLNNFYASVECMLHPELRGRCVAVCGSEEDRHGIVLAKNQEAKAMGVKTAETIWQARIKCPGLVVVSPHFDEYKKYSNIVRNIYRRYTDMIEPFGLDECWLDVTGSRMLFGSGIEIAEKIRHDVKEETGLTVSVGVSFNKVFAKLGSDLKKPDAVTVISRENFKNIVFPLSVDSIIGVGKATGQKLKKFGITTVGELADTPIDFLNYHFGKHGIALWKYANGKDDSPVTHEDFEQEVKSIGHGLTLTEDLTNNEEVWKVMFHLSRDIETSLREKDLAAASVAISVKDSFLETKEYQTPLKNPSVSAYDIAAHAFALFKNKYTWKRNVRSVTVRVIKLCDKDANCQLDFFEKDNIKREKAEDAAYEIEKRFGRNALTYASLMGDMNLPKNLKNKSIHLEE